jgi:hypothetical protein
MFGELKYKRLLPRGYQLRLTRPAHGGLIFIEFSILHTGEGFNAFFAREGQTGKLKFAQLSSIVTAGLIPMQE